MMIYADCLGVWLFNIVTRRDRPTGVWRQSQCQLVVVFSSCTAENVLVVVVVVVVDVVFVV